MNFQVVQTISFSGMGRGILSKLFIKEGLGKVLVVGDPVFLQLPSEPPKLLVCVESD